MKWTVVGLMMFSQVTLAQQWPAFMQQKSSRGELFVLAAKPNGTNIGVIRTEQGIVLIDPVVPTQHQSAFVSALKRRWPHLPLIVLNTHGHNDHSGGNAFFTAQGARIMTDVDGINALQSITVHSHSANDRVFYHRASNTVFVGDVYDSSWHPSFYAGRRAGFQAAISAILALGDANTRIVPGHGQPGDKAGLQRFHDDTVAWIDTVARLHAQGLSAEAMLQHPQINARLAAFNQQIAPATIPATAVPRFLQRTLSTLQGNSQ
ncbi:MBL fold metallo-hydrolase [Aestuariibacter halophilus]|uniref:MBL fold metallo-hydrolase n=1 Tax=Fluctibacter halophilus TaxID=226011 RepID=A0ABS8G4A9_9ALTE|nr:MBL fold metallo-hydrolase [Aestuariibacter halophilus]MCC2615273.1 MBL fold metallo-hydrolase [Aestuariibacter halophilus]